MKKRFLAILLTVVMVLALAVPAAAVTAKETKLDQVWHYNIYQAEDGVIAARNAVASKLVKTQHGNLYGYVNYNDQIVVQEKYTELHDFYEGLALAVKDGVVVYVDLTGKEVITVGVAKEAYDFHCGLARIVDPEGKTYFIDKTGKSVFTCGDATATDFAEVATGVYLARVQATNGKFGLVNTQGKEVTHFWWDELRPFSEGLAYVRNGSRQGFINTNGIVAFEVASYLNVGADVTIGGTHGDFSNGLVIVENVNAPFDARIGYLDTTGYQAVHCQFEQGDDFAGNVARVKHGGKWGYVGKNNLYTVQPEYDWLDRWNGVGTNLMRGMKFMRDTVAGGPTVGLEGNHVVVKDSTTVSDPYDHWGFVNVTNGAVAVPLKYTYARPFTNTDKLAYVELWGNKGFVNQTGTVVVNAAKYYDEIGDSYEGKAWVKKNGKWGYIATNLGGRLTIPMVYDVDGIKNYPSITMYRDVANEYRTIDNYKYANFNQGVAVACWGNVHAATEIGSDVGRYGVINASGNWLTTNGYTWVDYLIYADRVALARFGKNDEKIRFVFY